MKTRVGERISRRAVIGGVAAGLAAHRMGAAPAVAQSRTLKIGALLPLTGGLVLHAEQMWLGIQAAIAELNGSGGVFGQPVEVIYRDARGAPQGLARMCQDLVDEEGVSAVVGPVIAAGRKTAARALRERGVPLISASNNEGGYCQPNYFSLGPSPKQDMLPLIHHLDAGEGRSYFLVGSYSSWQHIGFRQAALHIRDREHGTVRGQAHTNIGERNFGPIIRTIAESEANTVVFCVPRPHGTAFVEQARAAGLLDKVRLGWVGFNELHAAHLKPQQSGQVITVAPFVSADPSPRVRDLVDRMHRVSDMRTPVTYYAFTHYAAVMAVAEACRKQGDTSPVAVLAGLPGLTINGPTGPVTIDATSHHASYNLVVAQGEGDRLAIVERLGQIAADPGCSAS